MKLKDAFLTQQVGDAQVMVATDSHLFSGMVRCNKTAANIVELLKQETSREAIIEAMLARYDAPREMIEKDVDKVLESLRGVGAIEE